MHVPSQPLDAITAFAVPNPNCPSQSRRFFQVWRPCRLPRPADHPVYFGTANFISLSLSTVDGDHLNRETKNVNANYWCNSLGQAVHNGECKWLLGGKLSTGESDCSRFYTNAAQRWGRQQNDERESNNRLDGGSGWAHLARREKFRGAIRVRKLPRLAKDARPFGKLRAGNG